MEINLVHLAGPIIDLKQRCLYCGIVMTDLVTDRVERELYYKGQSEGWANGKLIAFGEWHQGRRSKWQTEVIPYDFRMCSGWKKRLWVWIRSEILLAIEIIREKF